MPVEPSLQGSSRLVRVKGVLADGGRRRPREPEGARLVRLFEGVTVPFVIYALVIPAALRSDPLVAAFREFLFREVPSADRPLAPVAVEHRPPSQGWVRLIP